MMGAEIESLAGHVVGVRAFESTPVINAHNCSDHAARVALFSDQAAYWVGR